MELIYSTLVELDKDMNVVPGVAESWKWSTDGKVLTATLRKNVKFHDGTPMTSADVKFSFERILDEKTGAARARLSPALTKWKRPTPAPLSSLLKRPTWHCSPA